MTKSIKKIFAALLVVATLALMIPFSASAARDASTEVTFTLSDPTVVGKFKFDIYKIADIKTTGAVTTVTGLPTAVKTAVEAEGTDANTSTLITACKKELANLGSAVKTWDATTNSVTYTDLTAGIYYIHPVAKATATKIADSIVTTPKYDDATKSWVKNDNIDLASKVSTKDIVLDKTITNVDNTPVNAKYATAGLGSTVEFKLEANVPGSATSKLKKYAIADKMDAGLSFNKNSVKVYYTTDASSLSAADLVDAADYTVDAPFTAKDTEYTFAVNFKADTDGYVKKIYDADKKMVVVFNATVNENATVGKTSNDNKVSLDYANDDTEIVEPGPTVQVFAFNLQVVKEDNGGQKLAGAKFDLFKADKTTKIATATSDDNGLVQFTNSGKEIQLAAGTYYVQETEAPEGYVLPTGEAAWTEITVAPKITQKTSAGANDAQYELTGLTNAGDNTFAFVTKTVKNVKITVPKTGGMGTTIFTVCGASLIVIAGVMFVVLKRKKTSK
ncbi:MAG: SpaH/EbpB family LPXTG-anchored major pilin [Ruminococcus sp.]|nr:SpaH/EbpB family LPXTG-anchored major pilin [Ruminococcus sp.]MDD6709709.1 SpaH/EbpB family LPXTG-anchored major pilin [Ruminococcus sp.]